LADKAHTQEFEDCIQQVVKQGHEKGSAFAICTKSFQDAGKPIYVGESESQKLHLFSESIRIDGNKVSGVAIHPRRIFHPDEGLTHVYFREELEKAAPTLVGKPFGIDHHYVLPPPNLITSAHYDHKQDGVAFEGIVDDHIAEQIRSKAFKGLSIELNWLKPGGKVEYANGVAPRNFELTSCHLLKNFPPGDPEAFIRLFEQLVAGPPLPLDQRVEAVEKQMQEILNQINVINGKLDVLTSHHSPSAIGESAQPEPSQTKGEHEKMSTQNEGEPKQSEQTQAQQVEKQEPTGVEPPKSENGGTVSESEDVVALRKKIVDLEAKLAESEKTLKQQTESLQTRYTDFRKMIESTIPPSHIWKSWTPGPQKLIQAQLKVLRESQS